MLINWLKKTWKWLLGLFVGAAVAAPLVFNGPSDLTATGWDEQFAGESLFAEVENGVVLRVIVADADVINSGRFGEPSRWVRVHSDRGKRYNYASGGYEYDRKNDAFIPPKPYPSWLIDENYRWRAPVEQPRDGRSYQWDETTKSWVISE